MEQKYDWITDGAGHQDFGLLSLQACLDPYLPQKYYLILIALYLGVFSTKIDFRSGAWCSEH